MAKIVLTQSSMERLQTFITSGLATSNFFIDSAASATLSNDWSSFTNPVPDCTPIIIANGATVWTKEKGDIQFDGIGLLTERMLLCPRFRFQSALGLPHQHDYRLSGMFRQTLLLCHESIRYLSPQHWQL